MSARQGLWSDRQHFLNYSMQACHKFAGKGGSRETRSKIPEVVGVVVSCTTIGMLLLTSKNTASFIEDLRLIAATRIGSHLRFRFRPLANDRFPIARDHPTVALDKM
jgi:hypothetical protein